MEGQVGTKPARVKAAHLMCGSKLWPIVGMLCCASFAKVAASKINGVWAWSHDPWAVAAHLVWMLFMIGLITETRCWKERVFFGLVLINSSLGFAMGLWGGAPETVVHETRVISAGAWGAAALVSLGLLFAKETKGDVSSS